MKLEILVLRYGKVIQDPVRGEIVVPVKREIRLADGRKGRDMSRVVSVAGSEDVSGISSR